MKKQKILHLIVISLSLPVLLSSQTRNLHVEGSGGQLGVIQTTSTGSSISGMEFLRGNEFSATDWRIINDGGVFKIIDGIDNFLTSGTDNLHIESNGTMTLFGGGNAELGNGTGVIVLGDPSGENLALDRNGLIARNGIFADQLLLQTGPGMGDTYLNNLSGNVGIGTIIPGAKTEIYANSTSSYPLLMLKDETINGFARMHFQSNNSSDFWEVAGATGSTDLLRFRFDDNTIGINYLELTPDRMTLMTDLTINDSGISSLDFEVNGNSSARILAFGDGSLVQNANSSIQFRTNNANANQMILNDQGDLYVGQHPTSLDNALSAKMEIYHDSDNNDAHIELDEADPNGLARIKFRSGNSNDYWHVAAATGATDDFRVYYNDGSSGTNLMTISQVNTFPKTLFATDVHPNGTSFDLGGLVTNDPWNIVIANTFLEFSDAQLKKNIALLSENTLDKVLKLRPVTYQYIESHNIDNRLRNGLIAQEVQKVFPSVVVDHDVKYDEKLKNRVLRKSEYLAMNYMDLIPITIKAIQELNDKIEENAILKSRIERLEEAVFRN